MPQQRKIIHVDMDAFFASVEQRDNPELQGRPVIVGGAPDSRGVVAACSYEARKFGVHSAMPSTRAYRLCPDAVFVRHRFDAYKAASEAIHVIFSRYTDRIEPLSLDEAYLDVTACERYGGSATRIAQAIKKEIREETRLIASAGVSYNKFLAKIASDMDKPDGLYVITPDEGQRFVETLPIGRFYGVGKVTEAKMKALGIHDGQTLKQWSLAKLQSAFGRSADYYYHVARGIDNRPVEASRERKSIGAETTFNADLTDTAEMLDVLHTLAEEVVQSLMKRRLWAETVTVKVKYANFQQVTRACGLPAGQVDAEALYANLPLLLAKTDANKRAVRLLGVTASNLISQDELPPAQLTLL